MQLLGIALRKNRAMQKPPSQKPTQQDYIKTALRLPRELHAEIQDAAERQGRTMNAEILARLQAAPITDQLATQARDIAELKRMVKELLEK